MLFENVTKLVRQRSYWRRSGEFVQRRVCFANVQSSLHDNVVFYVCARMDIIFIMWNSISGLDAWYHFRFNISCGVAVMVRVHQKKIQLIFMCWEAASPKRYLQSKSHIMFA